MYKYSFHILFLVCLLLVQSLAFAQEKDSSFVDAQISGSKGPKRDFVVENIVFEGNKKTKPQVMLRELLFEQGDSIKAVEWSDIRQQSAKNLFNTSLFNAVSIEVNETGNGKADISIRVKERWYIWPIPVLEVDERNFNTWWQTKNLSRVSAGVFLTHYNFRGRKEELKLLVMGGYNQKFGVSYSAPYVNKKKTIGLGFQTIYTMRHEVNNKTEFDHQVFLKLNDEPIQRDWLSSVHLTYRPDFYFTAFFQFRYRQYNFADSLMISSPNYAPGAKTSLQYFGFYTKLKYDRRDYASYPLAGYYADIEMKKRGLGIFDNGLDMWNFQTTIRKYWILSPRWYYAIGFTGKLSAGMKDQPYIFNRSLGYGRDYVRAYQYYVVDGNSFALLKTNFKFALVRPRKVKMNFIKTEKFNTIPYAFYLNAYFDAGYVDQPFPGSTNKLPNTYIYGSGIGLDFVTYYDAVARFEFGVNKMGEVGWFLSFIAPI